MRSTLRSTLPALLAVALTLGMPTLVFAVDYESFEFNDANFSELHQAANTANPGNYWSTDIGLLTDSFVISGDYQVSKFNDYFAASYLQIDNVDPNTSGSRFIVVEVSGWQFEGFDPGDPNDPNDIANPEQIRFGFIDEDTGTSGNSVVAQMQITRDVSTGSTGNMLIEGGALGTGARSLSSVDTLGTVQTDPFTMVLELDKSSDTYEVFYKNGTNPSQSLGIGTVAPDRNGNSVRFVVNNNFGSTLDEKFLIDRIALTDTNPLTDLLTVEVQRETGEVKLINTTGSQLTGLESCTLSSAIGALDPNNWKPITDNYDNMAGPGDGSVDIDDDWATDPNGTTYLLGEASLQNGGANGGVLTVNQEVVLSEGGGLWIQNPIEDLVAEFTFAGGVVRRATVNFVGNGGSRFEVGDLNFDGSITADDWPLFMAGYEADLSAMSEAQAYQMGDLNYGGINSFVDLDMFKAALRGGQWRWFLCRHAGHGSRAGLLHPAGPGRPGPGYRPSATPRIHSKESPTHDQPTSRKKRPLDERLVQANHVWNRPPGDTRSLADDNSFIRRRANIFRFGIVAGCRGRNNLSGRLRRDYRRHLLWHRLRDQPQRPARTLIRRQLQ